ncbi:NAD(P)H-dependent oxidoreductase [Chitinivorax sp. B]|uniref:FMN-dependent NADH-azoreductase n=1 Tax=Chitinivorax sp. B TaxID=2502235 RepID=UPI0010F9C4C6|nr:NAD(P)H-dependent oxidoreductase [Chitinivorax sp. B]
MKLLHIDSSILGQYSASRELTAAAVAAFRKTEPNLEVIYHDLGSEPLPHLSPELMAPRGTPVELMTEIQRRDNAISDQLIDELKQADVVVIGAPLYNFTVPSALKSWIDRVTVAGKTFSYSTDGPVGLVPNKKAIIIATSGGQHGHTPVAHMHGGYVQTVLNFIGVQDTEVVLAEGLAMGPELKDAAMKTAREQLATLADIAAV